MLEMLSDIPIVRWLHFITPVFLDGGQTLNPDTQVTDKLQVDSTTGPWTFVLQTSFPSSGKVSSVELYAGSKGNKIDVGIFRLPSGQDTLEYRAMQRVTLNSVMPGYNRVSLI